MVHSLSDNRYTLHEVIGEGATATVQRAYDHMFHRWVAVKLLAPGLAHHRQLHLRLEREAKLMLRVDHPNVVKVFELGRTDEVLYLVMELVEGGSLLTWTNRHGCMPPRLVCDVGLQLCAGIGAAHAEGVVHRDVKPQNVLVTPDNVCKVADFGIARLTEAATSVTQTGVMMGSSGFMAPEQALDAKNAGVTADVFSIGATLLSLLTASVPSAVRPFFDERATELPEPLARVIMRATLDDPIHRYPSAAAMAEALRRIVDRMPGASGPDLYTEPHRTADGPGTSPTATQTLVAEE